MMVWLVILFLVGFGYLAVALVFATRQERMFFQPKRDAAGATPADDDLAYEEVALRADDGVRLDAWWLPRAADGAAGCLGTPFTLLYLHGAATNLGERGDALRFWHELGFAILAIDYRGYGRSEGRTTEAGLYKDARAAWRWLVDERAVEPRRVVVAAESLGVSLATELTTTEQPAGLVLEAGFTNAADIAVRRYRWLPVRQMMRIRLDNERRIGQVRCPKLIVHSVEDTAVPLSMGRRLHKRAHPPRSMLVIRGAHAQAYRDGGDRYRRGLVRWLEKLPRPE